MNDHDMRRFAELAQDFYQMKQNESGMIDPIKKAWASNEEGGLLIIVSVFGKHLTRTGRANRDSVGRFQCQIDGQTTISPKP